MNTKKNKNKKASKQPNPTPLQKEETEKIQEKIESENSDRADIISDIVTETESEVPKKPKRNRGKKKKHDKDDDDKNQEKTPETIKLVEENIKTPEIEINIIEGKTKQLSETDEYISHPMDKEINVVTELSTIENFPKTDPSEQDINHSKKKNKKKKRHDSDRSDKSGDALSCTAAFQKLLDVSDEKLTDTTLDIGNEYVEKKVIEDNIFTVSEDKKRTDVTADDLQDLATIETETLDDEAHAFTKVQKHEGKKKKNKKDKKHLPKPEDISIAITGECLKDSEETIQDQTHITNIQYVTKKDETEVTSTENTESVLDIIKSEKMPQDPIKPINIQDVIEKDNVQIVSQDDTSLNIDKLDEESPKPKATIAKPVDKKRKSKQEHIEVVMGTDICFSTPDPLILEQPSTVISMPDVQSLPKKEDIISDAPEIKAQTSAPKEEIQFDKNPFQEMLEPIEQLHHNITQEIIPPVEPDSAEQKNKPSDNKTGKKKRKPLKMPIPEPIIPNPIKSLEEMSTELIEGGTEVIGDVESIFETLVSGNIELKAAEEKLDEILEFNIESHDDVKNKSPAPAQQSDEKWTKPKRKGKKSLKMPSTPGVREEQFNLDTEIKKNETAKEPEVTAHHSPIETLEIRSMKADDFECSPCDVTPDIVYPRSTSQLNIDDNNNTVIREISIQDTLNLAVGLTSPLIQGSGETPIGTPIMISSINITEMESQTEKTDLKSKVLEVNQDMEELRLSIEKSLAELTAIEKSDEQADKNYEKAHIANIDITTSEKDTPKQTIIPTSNEESIKVQINSVNEELQKETERVAPLATQEDDKDLEIIKDTTEHQCKKDELEKHSEKSQCAEQPPICPARRDNKGKGKKRKGRQEAQQPTTTGTSTESSKDKKEEKTEEKSEAKKQSKQETKQKDDDVKPSENDIKTDPVTDVDYDPIEQFEDALTTSVDEVDVNKKFEMILNEVTDSNQKELSSNKPGINVTAPEEDFREGNVPQPKNLLGHPNIPVSSNKDDFKKEKHKNLNTKQAKVKIKDANDIDSKKESKQSQTESGKKSKNFLIKKSNENGDFIYKYSFRKVFLQNTCHVCAKELSFVRMPCNFCNLLFYCSIKHKDEDWPRHQALCFAISTIVHLKDQKHIYAEAKNITGQNYRLLRMNMILSCEKVLKRRLMPWEQEALLYPRICADVRCREWRQSRLKDCESCGQISYCADSLDHLPLSHQRWCKSYALYQKLVMHQQTKGRLEPKLPTKVMAGDYEIPEKINEVLATMYEEEIDMNDTQYAALTQIATAPLTVAYGHQLYRKATKSSANGTFKKSSFVIHVLEAELQFEADVLNKWEVFFLHLRPDVKELIIVLISSNLNPGNLPLELLGKINYDMFDDRLCESCQQNKRRVMFSFQDKKSYQEYRTSDDFIYPDIVCAFNASINRSSYNSKDQWPGIITSVMRHRSPFLITSHTPTELHRDLIRIKECGDVKVVVEPQRNSFASVRPDRNFITDDETPLLFKNQCFSVLCGV